MKALNPTMKNKIAYQQIAVQKHISYYAFTPENVKDVKDVLVLVHGISRNAKELIQTFAPVAEKHDFALIAPVFSEEYAKDYQRLGRIGKGPRSDYQLFAILKDYKHKYSQNFDKFHLFGYSAGAQFSHRFAFAHPNMVKKVALAAAGWYSLPTTSLPYPRGTRIRKQFTNIHFQPEQYLRTKFRVYIGKKDNKRDEALNKNPKIDLSQGKNRFERAKNWIELMQLAMLKRKIDNKIDLVQIKDTGHDFMQCVQNGQIQNHVMNWLLEENK